MISSSSVQMRILKLIAFITLGLAISRQVRANSYDLYRADSFKGAFCSAIGGACAADNDGENAFFQNPAALEAGEAGFNFDGDFNSSGNVEPGMKGSNTVSETTFMGGASWSGETWGIGISVTGVKNTIGSNAGVSFQSDPATAPISKTIRLSTSSTTVQLALPIAFRLKPGFSLGVSLTGLFHSEGVRAEGYGSASNASLNPLPTLGLAVGGIYQINSYVRGGTWFHTSSNYYFHQTLGFGVLGTSYKYDEDLGLKQPWVLAHGIAYTPWQDKRTLFVEVDLIGSTDNGFQFTHDNFAGSLASKTLRPKGRSLALEPHLGWKSPWWDDSRASVLLGCYYEAGRADGVNARVHGTGGLAYKFPGIAELLAGVDVAHDFVQLLFTIR